MKALLLLLLCLPGVAGSLISASSLQLCTNGVPPSGSSVVLSCEQRIVVTLSVPTGQSLATDALTFTQNVSTLVDPSGNSRQLAAPLQITVTKSAVWAVYPLTYQQSFNARMYEAVVLTTDCVDGALESDTTCGWFTDASGNHILDSQGFCCPCDAATTWQQTVLGGPTDLARGSVNCNFFAQGMFMDGIPASASCPRLSPNWLAGYRIGAAAYEFNIRVVISQAMNDTNSTGMLEVLTLSPSSLVAVNTDQTVSAELLGDLGGFQESLVLQEKMLFIPIPNASQSDSGPPGRWPIIDISGVSLNGEGCDQPGVSFAGFYGQPNRCTQPVGTCLGHQLQDVIDADASRMQAGLTPQYNLAGLGVGNPELHDAQPGATQANLKRLALPSTTLRNSIVLLQVSAAEVSFVKNYSPGHIVSVALVDFNDVAMASFVALSGNGHILASFVNNGTLAAEYYLSVVNCSADVTAVQSPGAVSVAAGALQNQSFPCAVQDDQSADRNCTLVLQDALFRVIDTQVFFFHTNATVYDTVPTLHGGDAATGPGSLSSGDGSCSSLCPQLMNLMCAFENWCWTRLFEGLVIYAALLSFCYWTFVKWGPCRLASKLGGGSRASDAEEEPRTRRQRRRGTEEYAGERCDVAPGQFSPPSRAGKADAGDEEEAAPHRLELLIRELEAEIRSRREQRRR